MKRVLVIPDTQVKPGSPIDHLWWIGMYWVDHKPDIVVHLGDHAHMDSLSAYEKPGTLKAEGRRYADDISAANRAWSLLNDAFWDHNATRRKWREKLYKPELHVLLGNHEDRITRAINSDPRLHGKLSLDDLDYERTGWQVHPFLEVLEIDGVHFSHYFYSPNSGRPWGGMAQTMLKNVGITFVQGHRQGLDIANRFLANGKRQRGIIAGSCYLEPEEYRGPQAKMEWVGVLMLNELEDGHFDLCEVSLDFLCRKYEGVRLREYTPTIFA